MPKFYLFINDIGKYSPKSVVVFRQDGDEAHMHPVERDACVYDLEAKLVELDEQFDFESVGISAEGDEYRKIEALVESSMYDHMHR